MTGAIDSSKEGEAGLQIGNRAAALGVRLLETLLRAMPPSSIEHLSWLGGHIWYRVDKRRRKRCHENLRVAFGGSLSEAQRARMVPRVFMNMFRVPLEVAWFQRLLRTPRDIERRVRTFGDEDKLRTDGTTGRGGLFLSAHLANWEVGAHILRVLGYPVKAVMRPLASPALHDLVVERRGGPDAVLMHEGAARKMTRTIRDGGWVAVLLDQGGRTSGIFVPFFGLAARTEAAPMRVAAKWKLPVYLATTHRQRGPCAFDIHLERLPAAKITDDASAVAAVSAFHSRLERRISEQPTAYNWLHRRWRARPPGEGRGPHLPQYDHHRKHVP